VSVVGVIWATRGRSWDFRFLLKGGYFDPLPAYERAFVGLQGEVAGCQRVNEVVALRFPDPLNRKDDAGRVIPHDFVVPEPLASEIRSIDEGREKVWPLVAHIYAQVWSEKPPWTKEIQSALQSGSLRLPDVDHGTRTSHPIDP
jgi:hypothetical protein